MQTGENKATGTRATSIAGIERATGRSWDDWLAIMEGAGAQTLGHAGIAKLARSHMADDMKSVDWWAQGVAIAYEQHAGLRVPGQGSDGLFRVSASRTLDTDREAAIDAWVATFGERSEFEGHDVMAARRNQTEKRSFWRFSLAGAGKVEVSATPKAPSKSATDAAPKVTLAISHDALPAADEVERWRAFWKERLAELG